MTATKIHKAVRAGLCSSVFTLDHFHAPDPVPLTLPDGAGYSFPIHHDGVEDLAGFLRSEEESAVDDSDGLPKLEAMCRAVCASKDPLSGHPMGLPLSCSYRG